MAQGAGVPALSSTPPQDVLDTPLAGGLIVRGGSLRAAGYVVGTGLSVLSFALVTRHLGVARFGDYQTALSIVTVVATVTDAGMATLAIREYATLEGDLRERLMRNLLGIRLLLTSIGVAAAGLVALTLGFDTALIVGTVLAGVGIGLNVVQSMIAVPLSAQLRLGATTALEVGRQAVLVAVIVAVVVFGGGVVPLLAATIPAGLAGVVATALVLTRDAPLRPTLDRSEIRRLARLTVPVALTVTAGAIYVYLVQILTNAVASEVESGLFAASFRVFIVIGAIPGLIAATAFPLLARTVRDDSRRLAYAVDRLFRTMLLGGALVSVALAAAAPIAIDVVAGPSFDGAVEVLRIQSLALLASFAVATLSFTLLSLRLHRAILAINLSVLAVTAVLGVLFINGAGAAGAAWATVAGEAVLVGASWLVLALKRPDVAPRWTATLPAVAPLVIAGGVAYAMRGSPALAALAGAVSFTAVALLTRAVPGELRDLLPARLRHLP